jgi:hypothetical protein
MAAEGTLYAMKQFIVFFVIWSIYLYDSFTLNTHNSQPV